MQVHYVFMEENGIASVSHYKRKHKTDVSRWCAKYATMSCLKTKLRHPARGMVAYQISPLSLDRFWKFKNWHTQEKEPVVWNIIIVVRKAFQSSHVTTWQQKGNTVLTFTGFGSCFLILVSITMEDCTGFESCFVILLSASIGDCTEFEYCFVIVLTAGSTEGCTGFEYCFVNLLSAFMKDCTGCCFVLLISIFITLKCLHVSL